jgi:hypothetical protein
MDTIVYSATDSHSVDRYFRWGIRSFLAGGKKRAGKIECCFVDAIYV